jgi:hypothetical protein
MSLQGHQETLRPRKPRGRFTSVTGPRCGRWWESGFNETREIVGVFALAVSSLVTSPLFVSNPRLLNDLVAAGLRPTIFVDNANFLSLG